MIQLIHVRLSALVDDLKLYDLPSIAPRTPNEVAEFRRTFSDAVPSMPTGSSTSVSTMLETAMEELFVPYTEGQRYLERESRSLGFLYSTLLAQFTRYHVRSLKGYWALLITRHIGKNTQGQNVYV